MLLLDSMLFAVILILCFLAHSRAHIPSEKNFTVAPFTLNLGFRKIRQTGKVETERFDVNVCANERMEDAFDTFFFHVGFYYGPMEEEYRDKLRRSAYSQTGTKPDGHPPRTIIGMLEKRFFVREHYDPVDVFLCYCSKYYGCSSDQRALSVWSYIDDSIREAAEAAETQTETDTTLTLASPPPPRIGISLGMTCRAAKLGVEMGLRHTKAQGYRTGPFDLMLSNYEGVIQCIKDDFRYFTDSRFLQLGTDHNIRNTYYNFTFIHESPAFFPITELTLESPEFSGENHFLNDDFFFLKERYQRRIESFLTYVRSDTPILFIFEFQAEVGDRDTEQLDRVLREKYPRLDFRIKTLWTHNDEDVMALLYETLVISYK